MNAIRQRLQPEQLRELVLVSLIILLLLFFSTQIDNYLTGRTFNRVSTEFPIIAVVAVGQLLVVLTRNLDLSVGSQVGIAAMLYALLMADWMPALLGIELGDPFAWLIALAIGLTVGVIIGGVQGFIVAYIGVPSFVVTLGPAVQSQ